MRKRMLMAALLLSCCACGSLRGPDRLHGLRATLSLTEDRPVREILFTEPRRDTLTVTDPDGKEVFLMRAVRDFDGEMVATDVISAARVTARFRNVAERGGKVDLRFDVTVPRAMQDSRWQLRFRPVMDLGGERIPLDPVVITGKAYRKAQLRGYQQYQRFLDSIVSDPTLLIDERQFETFIRRNLPNLYRFRSDTSVVTDEHFASAYGVTERQAVEHYALRFKIRRNERRIAMKDRMFDRYVKAPVLAENLRLDTVLADSGQDFTYSYVQTLRTRPGLRKVGLTLSGEIHEQGKRLFRIPESDSLTFYISTLASFADDTERYLFRIVPRRAEAHTACYLDFAPGSAELDLSLGANAEEAGRIRSNFRELAANEAYAVDSVVVTASCSPEGSHSANERLSLRRAETVSMHFRGILQGLRPQSGPVRFIARSNPENWPMLDALVAKDSLLTDADKASYSVLRNIPDADLREDRLRAEPYYRHLREKLYPRLRTVRFDFYLHRKGMQQDTLYTTEPDTVYRNGVRALRDRDYERAATLLRPYQDCNTAVAFLCLGYDEAARDILRRLDPTATVHYLLAIVHARQGEEREAAGYYLRACGQDASFVHRGHLDPEISELIRRYGPGRDPGR